MDPFFSVMPKPTPPMEPRFRHPDQPLTAWCRTRPRPLMLGLQAGL